MGRKREVEGNPGVMDDEQQQSMDEDKEESEAEMTESSESSQDEADSDSDSDDDSSSKKRKNKKPKTKKGSRRLGGEKTKAKSSHVQIFGGPEELLAAVQEYQAIHESKKKKPSATAAVAGKSTVSQPADLKAVTMRDYQLEGMAWLAELHEKGHGGILADEMGLGKTLQSIAFLLHLRAFGEDGPFLVLAPLSVLNNWENELRRFAPSLGLLIYTGAKDRRQELRDEVVDFVNSLPKAQRSNPPFKFQVVLTTYEVLNGDIDFLVQFDFKYLIVDEAARLKNSGSLLYQNLERFKCRHRLLLTGTPVQNNLVELHSLLHFIKPDLFSDPDSFQRWFSPKQGDRALQILHKVIKPFLLRRLKEEVVKELPQKREFTLYVGLTALQKDMYKGILTKDTSAFDGRNKTSLMNILSQLRKVVNHPYLFDGVEPEPFELGDHLANASGKLSVLDNLLPYLKRKGRRILLFSQMTRVLDIVQDYLYLRGYSYERLDGSVRGEERYLAIKNFNEDPDTFVFLLSTRAGGVGLNLTSADTVIFFDSDFNPQADLQAAARAHRLGQTKEVQVIRLISRDTVEEIILKRANKKLRLSASVMSAGLFHSADAAKTQAANLEKWQTPEALLNILKFGMDNLLENLGDDKKLTDDDFDQIFKTRPEDLRETDELPDDDDGSDELEGEVEQGASNATSMYVFKGKDYSEHAARRAPSQRQKADDEAFRKLTEQVRKSTVSPKSSPASAKTSPGERKARQTLTPEYLEILREEAQLRKLQKREAEQQKREQKKAELWRRNNYQSSSLPFPPALEEDSGDQDLQGKGKAGDEEETSELAINYVTGDMTQPVVFGEHPTADTVAIVVNCVDNSGSWGSGGVFTSLNKLSPFIGARYEAAGENDDLQLGDVHVEKIEQLEGGLSHPGKLWIANIVAQKRDKKGVSGVQLPALEEAFRKLSHVAKASGASVHLPRIGQRTPNFNWYGTERLVRKWFCAKAVLTYIYYFPRKRRQHGNDEGSSSLATPFYSPPQTLSVPLPDSQPSSPSSSGSKRPRFQESPPSSLVTEAAESHTLSAPLTLEGTPLADIFTGMRFHFSKIPASDVHGLTRKIVAFDGEVAEALDGTVTHVLYDDEGLNDEGLALVVDNPNLRLVTLSWLKDSIVAKKALDPRPYSLVDY